MRACDPARVLCESDYHAWAELAPRTAGAIEAYGAACGVGAEELMAQLLSNFHRYYHYAETIS